MISLIGSRHELPPFTASVSTFLSQACPINSQRVRIQRESYAGPGTLWSRISVLHVFVSA